MGVRSGSPSAKKQPDRKSRSKKRFDIDSAAKLIRNLVILLFAVVFLSVLYNRRNKEYETTTALMSEAVASKEFKGVFIRDEEVIPFSGDGVLSYSVPDGGKLGSGSVIARVFPDDTQPAIDEEVQRLERQLAVLKKIQNPGTLQSAQPASLSEGIGAGFRSLLYDRDMKNYTAVDEEMDSLLVQMSTYQVITDETDGFEQELADIQNKLAELDSMSVKPTDILIADRSAYFVSSCDGYETRLTPDSVSELTAADIDSIGDDGAPGSEDIVSAGKLIDGYSWQLAGVIDNSRHTYAIGESIGLRFQSSADIYSAVITDIRDEGDPSRSVFIMQSSEFNSALVQHRAETTELIKDDFKGLRVPRDAIRFRPGEIEEKDPDTGEVTKRESNLKGVYVVKGDKIEFKQIDVIYEGSDYVLSRVREDDSEYLALYDDILMEGVDTD
ncbi:MAG: hypothetical protein IJ874_07160 [Ruminococcus sp.]|nr:hypothetical protein [Ruminococcus sp.]